MGLGRYLRRRLIDSALTILGLTLISFFLIHLVPGDPVVIMLGGKVDPERIIVLRHQLGLDRPLISQYFSFLGGLFHLNFGTSILMDRPVESVVAPRIVVSCLLVGYGTLIAIVLALPLGVVSALRRNRPADHGIRILTLIGFAMPSFWLSLLLVRTFSLQLGWFPVAGYGINFVQHLKSLTLPAIVIGLFLAAILVRSLRASLIDVLDTEYIEAARARGLSERSVIWMHALRNGLIATITVLGVNIGWLIGGTVVIEDIFGIPGMGQLLVQSIYTRDFPIIEILTLVFGVLAVLANLVADILYAFVDPRVRYG